MADVLRWLDKAEREHYVLDKGTAVKVKKEPLQEHYQQYKILQTDIDNHRPVVEAINRQSGDLIRNSEPQVAQLIQSNLEKINQRYAKVDADTQGTGQYLTDLTDKLNEFVKQVDSLEDWELPVINTIENSNFMQGNLNEVASKLMDSQRQMEGHTQQLNLVRRLGSELLKHPKASDTSFVSTVLDNTNRNWESLEDAIEKRTQQLEERQAATKKYNTASTDTNYWLDTSERRVKQLQPVSMDRQTVQMQLKEVQPLRDEVISYKPTMTDLNKVGNNLDRIIKVTNSSTATEPHLRSTTLGQERKPGERLRPKMAAALDQSGFFDEESPIKDELNVANDRYDDLLAKLKARAELLELISEYMDLMGRLGETHDWIQKLDNQINMTKSGAGDLESLQQHQSDFANLRNDFEQRRVPIQDVISDAETFLRVNRNQLTGQQAQDMQDKINALRRYLDQVMVITEQIVKETETQIMAVNLEMQEQSQLGLQFQEVLTALQDLLDWVKYSEEQHSSEQPLAETQREVHDQNLTHTKLNTDVQDHSEPVQRAIEDANTLLKAKSAKLTQDDQRVLQENSDELRTRYDQLNKHSSECSIKVPLAENDLAKIEEDFTEFGDWLRSAEQELDAIVRNIATDGDHLQQQVGEHKKFTDNVVTHSADLKYTDKGAQQFLNFSKTYRDFLREFRNRVASREFMRSFQENKESGVIFQTLADFHARYERLRTACFDHGDLLGKLVEKHTKYWGRVGTTQDWLQGANDSLREIMKEPICAETVSIRRQIEKLANFRKEVGSHQKDVDGVTEAGVDLSQAQPNIGPTVDRTTGDIVDDYEALQAQINDRSNALEDALAKSQNIHDNIDELMSWLDNKEKDVHMMNKGTVVVVKSAPMEEQMSQGKMMVDEIEIKKPVLEQMVMSANTFVENCAPEEGMIIKQKLDNLHARYNQVSGTSKDHGQQLSSLKDKLNDFERALDELEDWLLPKIARVESKEFMTQELPRIGDEIQQCRQEIDHHRPQYKVIHDLANELMKHPKATDVSEVKTMLKNCELNWDTLENALAKRAEQFDRKQAAAKKFNTSFKETTGWIDNQLRRIDQMGPVARDAEQLKRQIREIKPFQTEVKDYKPSIDENWRFGTVYDRLISETEDTINTRTHSRSTEIDVTKPIDARPPTYATPDFIEDKDTFVDVQMAEVQEGYKAVQFEVSERLEDLELMLQFLERCGGIFGLQDWANETETKLHQLKPTSRNVEELERQIEAFKPICKDIADHRVPVSDVTVHAEQFIRNTKDKLTPELQTELTGLVTELRDTYERLLRDSQGWQREAEDTLAALKKDRDETMSVEERVKELMRTLQDLLDWVSQAERHLGSEQPQEEAVQPLTRQQQDHQVLHENIQQHQQPILEAAQDVESLIKQFPKRIDEPTQNNLRSSANDLKSRYNVVNYQSTKRQTKLGSQTEELQKYADDEGDFERWLIQAEKTQADVLKNVGRDLTTLKKQNSQQKSFNEDVVNHVAELRFINVTGQKFLDGAKVYRQELADFRNSVLPRDFIRNFSENPNSNLIRDKIADFNQRFDRLKLTSAQHLERLQDLVERHTVYVKASDRVLDWLPGAEDTLGTLLREPIAAEPANVQKQIDKLETLRDDVVLHLKDIENVKDAGNELLEVQEELRPEVTRNVNDITKRYDDLNGKIAARLNELQAALAKCTSVQESMEMLLRWLDESERNVHQMEKGTLIAVKREPLLENLQEQKVIMSDIENHLSAVDAVNTLARPLIQSSEPKEARQLQSKLDSINERYGKVDTRTKDHGVHLDRLSRRLSDFEEEVENLEDWLLPSVDELESKQIAQLPLPEFGSKLQSVRKETDAHRPPLKKVHQLGDELIKDTKAKDTSYVTSVLSNVDANWKAGEKAYNTRNKQHDDLQNTTKKYETDRKDVLYWLDNTERRLDQVQPQAMDANTVQILLKELRPLQKEITDYKPKIDNNAKNGQKLDTVIRDTVQPLQSVPHYRSTELGNIGQQDQAQAGKFQEPVEFIGETPVQSEVYDVNNRYDNLKHRINATLEDIALSEEWVNNLNKVNGDREWVTASDTKMERARPMANDIPTLTKEIEVFRGIHSDVRGRQPNISDTVNGSELFLRKNKDRLSPKQNEDLSQKSSDLRREYDDIYNRSDDWLREAIDRLNRMEMDEEQRLRLETELREKGTKLQDLLDWLVKAEQALAAQQPLNEKSPQVVQQYTTHKPLHDDIQAHQQPILQCVEDIEQLLKTLGDRVGKTETKRLRDGQDELRGRYEAVHTQSQDRLKTLTQAIQDLEKFEVDFTEFTDWLQSAERKMDNSERNVAIELVPLKQQQADHAEFGEDVNDQKGDLKFLNKGGQAFIDMAKVYRQRLAEFRSILPRQQSRAFQEAAEPNIIRGQLTDINARFDKLKLRYGKHLRLLNELVAKHQLYADSVGGVSTWLGNAEATLSKMKSEPIGATKETILRQIEKAETFHQDVVAHASDVENVKANGEELIGTQPAVKQNVQRTTGDIVKRYDALEMGVNDFLEKLRVALANTQGVMENLDMLEKWLDEAEKEQHKLEKGTVTPARREPILDQIENNKIKRDQKVLEDDIASHRTPIDSVNVAAKKLMTTVPPNEAKLVQEKLNRVNDRYGNVSSAARDHGEGLMTLSKKLSDFEKEVDDFEDWLLPDLETLESEALMKQELSNTANTLKDISRRHDAHKPQYSRIHKLAEALLSDSKANDTSYVTSVVNSVDKNYLDFEEALKKRNKDLDRKRDAEKKYGDRHRDTTQWLTGMERKVNQLPVSGKDLATVQKQLQESKPIQEEVIGYKPSIDTCNKLGHTYDSVIRETDQPIVAQPHIRSLQATMPKGGQVKQSVVDLDKSGVYQDDETPTERQLSDVNRRYDDLLKNMQFRIDDLNLTRQYIERDGKVGEQLEWVTATETKLARSEPRIPATEIEPLEKEIENLEKLVTEISAHKIPIDDVSLRSEQFVADNKDVLPYDKQDSLNRRTIALKDGYGRLNVTSTDWLKDANDELNRLKHERDQGLSLAERLQQALAGLADLLDWVAEAERRLGSEQPMSEVPKNLGAQAKDHKVLHEDIVAHQQPVVEVVQTAQQLIDQFADRLKPTDRTKLQDLSSELKKRYDVVYVQSQTRENRLNGAIPELDKILEDNQEITQWLGDTDRQLQVAQKDIGRDLKTLKDQFEKQSAFNEEILTEGADVRFLNMNAKRNMDGEKVYRQELANFRQTVLPRKFNDSFREEPEPTVLRDIVNNANGQYGDLKTASSNLTQRLRVLVDHHQLFNNAVEGILPWLGNAETTLAKLLKEPISADPTAIEKQIEKLQDVTNLRNDVVQHLSDVEKVNDTANDLVVIQPAVERDVTRQADDIDKRYRALEGNIDDRLAALRRALSQSQGVQENLDMLLRWLDKAERDCYNMEKGTLISLQKEPLLENMESQQILQKDIVSHKPDIDAVKQAATQLIKTSEPQEAKLISDKLAEVNDRYKKVGDTTSRHGDVLKGLVDRVGDFENRVDKLEDWELPVIQTLNAKEMGQMDTPKLIGKLKDVRQQVDGQRPALKQVQQMGEQLIKEPRANDTSHVKGIIANVNLNWATLEDSLGQRMKQVDDLQAASDKYGTQHKDTTFWLTNMERRVDQARPHVKDKAAIKARLKELKPFLEEVDAYEPNIMSINKTGDALDALKRDVAQAVPCKPLQRSTQPGLEAVPASRIESEPHIGDDTPVQRELDDVNQRYADLRKHLIDCLDDLHVAERCNEETDNAQDTLDWVEATNAKLVQAKPKSREIEPLREEVKAFKTLQAEVQAKQPQVSDTISSAEHFKREYRDKLSDDQRQPLEEKVDKLKSRYDQVYNDSNDWLRDSTQALDDLVREEEERKRVDTLLREKLTALVDLLDWVSQAEHALGSEQPQSDQSQPLQKQVESHKVLHDDVLGHQQPVARCTQDVVQFLQQYGDRISPENFNKLQDGGQNLQSRFDVVLNESYVRTNQLNPALEEVKKFEQETDELETFLGKTENKIDVLGANVGTDYATLKSQLDEHRMITEDINDQKGDRKFINKTGATFQEQATAYRDTLTDFRNTVLPRTFTRNFQENPEPEVMRNRISTINDRMDTLKTTSGELGEHLRDLVDKHEKYNSAVDGFNGWCGDAEKKLGVLEKEPVGTEPVSIMKQIDRVKDFNDDVIAHGRDLERVKSTGNELVDAQPELKPSVDDTKDESNERYQALLAHIADLLTKLNTALATAQGLQGSLDALLRWLDQAERDVTKMDRGTIIIAKKEPLVENMEEQMVINTDIVAHQPAVESVVKAADEVLLNSEPEEARNIQSKVDSIQKRYDVISDVTGKHGEDLQLLNDKLSDFEKEVDNLEDFVIPGLETLEAKDLMRMDMNQLGKKLNDMNTQIEAHRPQYKLVHELGEEIVNKTKAKDTSYVNAVLANVDKNWKDLQDLKDLRKKQLTQKQQATNKYNTGYRDTNTWITTKERTLSQLQPVAMDSRMLSRQEKEIKPFQLEVAAYKPTMDELNKVGNNLDTLLRELEAPVKTTPHYKSLQLSTGLSGDQIVQQQIKDTLERSTYQEPTEDSDIKRQLGDVNRRYDGLKIRIKDRQDDIDLARLFLDRLGDVNNRLDWCANADSKLMKLKPTSRDLEKLKTEFDKFKDFEGSVNSNKPAILETIVTGEQFARENQDRLLPEQQEELQRKTDELRTYFDTVENKAAKIDGDTKANIDNLEFEISEEMRVRQLFNDALGSNVKLLDWVSDIERRLGSEQPIKEETKPLNQQASQHKVLHEEILSRQQPVMEAVHTATQLVDQYSSRLRDADAFKLKNTASDLKTRFDNAVVQSYTRNTKLGSSAEDIGRYDGDINEFDDWLTNAERSVESKRRAVPKTLEELEKSLADMKTFEKEVVTQGADLKYITKTGNKFLDNAKVYKEELADYRKSALPRDFNANFREEPETNVIRDHLGKSNDRYNALKLKTNDLTSELSDLVDCHRRYNKNLTSTDGWLKDARESLDALLQEPIASEPINIQKQIDTLKTLHDDVVLHGRDVDDVKSTGEDLIDLQPATKPEVNQATDDAVRRYHELEGELADRMRALRKALADSQSVQDSLDALLRWLDDKEKTLMRMMKGTVIVVKKEPLVENLQEYRLLEKEIENHRPTIESVFRATNSALRNFAPEERAIYQDKMNDFDTRFGQLTGSLKEHGENLQGLSGNLVQLELKLDDLEEWLMPLLETLESGDFNDREIPEVETAIKEIIQDVDAHRPECQAVHALGEELISHPKAGDTSFVSAVLTNLDQNWTSLEDVVAKRVQQLEDRQVATRRYDSRANDVNYWLDNMEDKLGKLDLEVQDIQAVDLQIQHLKPLQREITDYRPKIVEVNKVGSALDNLIRDIMHPLDNRRHYWSSQIGATLQTEWTPQKPKAKRAGGRDEPDKTLLEDDTEVEKELEVTNKRYDELNRRLADALEDLRIVRLCADKVDSLQNLQEWVNQIEARLTDTKPTSRELQPLVRELDVFKSYERFELQMIVTKVQPIHAEVADHRPVILEVVHSAEQFLRDHRDRLHPNLQNKLKGLTSNLRSSYEQASLKSNDWLKEATQVLDLLKSEESDQVAVDELLQATIQALDDELEWIPIIEKRLGSGQPFAEESKPLAQQEVEHKAIHDEIQNHKTPVLQALQETQSLIRQHSQSLRPEDQNKND
ncbi:microtubule-actin cross-linking factor 1-like isoform X4 [Lytechinus variegatus]|uniref:microtubule-actin cross-linking factor 1-like isoform X4 n=1 Tax=Lytechinus variegatus TaxID=7654 RepID=UPI001BB12336|nr:microtubule-actin cross-linking factor 1-like isoform X4 [Lytechinus variegatus]